MARKGMFLKFLDAGKEVLYDRKLTSLKIKETLILQKSMEFFSDPSPCMIHRSAVMKRIYAELEEYLLTRLHAGISEHEWETIPQEYLQYYELDGQVCYVQVEIVQ